MVIGRDELWVIVALRNSVEISKVERGCHVSLMNFDIYVVLAINRNSLLKQVDQR